jgi:isocitrate dehydrogenase kinase/phosphatase
VWSPKDYAAAIAEQFRAYNDEFGRITRRAALNFLAEDWRAAQQDAVARIELYEQRVTGCVLALAEQLQARATDSALWIEIKRAYEGLVARRPDSDFYRTFFNSV